jgi:hypothetical protein
MEQRIQDIEQRVARLEQQLEQQLAARAPRSKGVVKQTIEETKAGVREFIRECHKRGNIPTRRDLGLRLWTLSSWAHVKAVLQEMEETKVVLVLVSQGKRDKNEYFTTMESFTEFPHLKDLLKALKLGTKKQAWEAFGDYQISRDVNN